MRIDEARADIPPSEIDLLIRIVGQPDANDALPSDGDISLDDLTCENVDHSPIAKQKVSRFVAPSN
jgi:hypothetical protein